MTPTDFPEANSTFAPPSDLEESQCRSIRVFVGRVEGGSCDGADQVITAWQPSEEEIAMIAAGAPVFLSCLGGLPPHYLTTSFEHARRCA